MCALCYAPGIQCLVFFLESMFSFIKQNSDSGISMLSVSVKCICDFSSCSGLSALQLASVALKSIVGDMEKGLTVSQTRVHSMRKEQMMETLKCLLQMECNLQCLVRVAVGQVNHTIDKVTNYIVATVLVNFLLS